MANLDLTATPPPSTPTPPHRQPQSKPVKTWSWCCCPDQSRDCSPKPHICPFLPPSHIATYCHTLPHNTTHCHTLLGPASSISSCLGLFLLLGSQVFPLPREHPAHSPTEISRKRSGLRPRPHSRHPTHPHPTHSDIQSETENQTLANEFQIIGSYSDAEEEEEEGGKERFLPI